MTRRIEHFKRMTLTDFKLEMPRLAAKKVMSAAWTEAGEELPPPLVYVRRGKRCAALLFCVAMAAPAAARAEGQQRQAYRWQYRRRQRRQRRAKIGSSVGDQARAPSGAQRGSAALLPSPARHHRH